MVQSTDQQSSTSFTNSDEDCHLNFNSNSNFTHIRLPTPLDSHSLAISSPYTRFLSHHLLLLLPSFVPYRTFSTESPAFPLAEPPPAAIRLPALQTSPIRDVSPSPFVQPELPDQRSDQNPQSYGFSLSDIFSLFHPQITRFVAWSSSSTYFLGSNRPRAPPLRAAPPWHSKPTTSLLPTCASFVESPFGPLLPSVSSNPTFGPGIKVLFTFACSSRVFVFDNALRQAQETTKDHVHVHDHDRPSRIRFGFLDVPLSTPCIALPSHLARQRY